MRADTELCRPEERIDCLPFHARFFFSFDRSIAPSLQIDVNPLHDVCGPAIERADIEGIVVSLETLVGGELINQKRLEKGMKPLTILTVNRSSKYNLSSTFIREMSSVWSKHALSYNSNV